MDEDLPGALGAFRRERWRRAGVRRYELEAALGRPTHRGRWAWAGTDRADPVQRALEDASVLGDEGAVGGWGAAQLLGVAWLDGTTPSGDPVDGLLCLPPEGRVRRPGLVVRRSRLDPGDVVLVPHHGVRVTSPVRTAFDLARWSPDRSTAVAHLDAMLSHGVRAGDVDGYALDRRRWRGCGPARSALVAASSRVRSPAETRFRLLWTAVGLPQPLVNATLVDLDGVVLAEPDLLDVATGLVGEYDGAPHSDAERRSKDHRRHEMLEQLGLTVVRVTGADDLRAPVTRSRLLQAAARAAAASTGRRRWRAVERPLQVGRLHAHVVV